MNIFVTDALPSRAAQYLDDKRVTKMILESTQLLASALHHFGKIELVPFTMSKPSPVVPSVGDRYRKTKSNHPCSVWVRSSQPNFDWLSTHAVALCEEYAFRNGKHHHCYEYLSKIMVMPSFIPPSNTPFSFRNASRYKDVTDPIDGYRLTMTYKWKVLDKNPKWTRRERPHWYRSYLNLMLRRENMIGSDPDPLP